MEKLIAHIEEGLVFNDENRKEVQSGLQTLCSVMTHDIDQLEDRLSQELMDAYSEIEVRTNTLYKELSDALSSAPESAVRLHGLVDDARKELTTNGIPSLRKNKKVTDLSNEYELTREATKEQRQKMANLWAVSDPKKKATLALNELRFRINNDHDCIVATQDKIAELCSRRRSEVTELNIKINEKLSEVFTQRDSSLQSLLATARALAGSGSPEEVRPFRAKAIESLVNAKKYRLKMPEVWASKPLADMYDLDVVNDVIPKYLGLEEVAPTNISASITNEWKVKMSLSLFNENKGEIIKAPFICTVSVWQKGHDNACKENNFKVEQTGKIELNLNMEVLSAATYCFKVCVKCCETQTKWSEAIELTTPEFSEFCAWKECPDYVYKDRKYSVDEKNSRIATKINKNGWSTIIGNTPLPQNKVTSWYIKILASWSINGCRIFIGVAPSNINQNEGYNCGWYFDCCNSTLHSGPPHNYRGKEYGPRKENEQYVHTGDNVGVVMDTAKGELSFVVNGVNLGVAYKGIPLDKPLVPCVLLYWGGDSVHFEEQTFLVSTKHRFTENNLCLLQ